jgi:type IV pilus assembly protein PilX
MRRPNQATLHGQGGMVLITSLLLLLILTMLAVSMFRSYGIEERIAGNTRDKQRARGAAISALQFAENWLSSTATLPTPAGCAGVVLSTGAIPICSAPAPTNFTTTIPWTVGVTYTQFTANAINNVSNVVKSASNSATADTATQAASYWAAPMFYITDLGPAPITMCAIGGEVYQIDAVGYGGTADTVAVVESTYILAPSTCKPADK